METGLFEHCVALTSTIQHCQLSVDIGLKHTKCFDVSLFVYYSESSLEVSKSVPLISSLLLGISWEMIEASLTDDISSVCINKAVL